MENRREERKEKKSVARRDLPGVSADQQCHVGI